MQESPIDRAVTVRERDPVLQLTGKYVTKMLRANEVQPKGSVKNNFTFWRPSLPPDSAAPQSRNPQRRPGYACGFAQSFATKSGGNLSTNSANLFLTEP